jgi:hypothetical protein
MPQPAAASAGKPRDRIPQGNGTLMTSSNPFDSSIILEGIRRWVEIETPTEAPDQINELATLVADGYRELPATIERIAGCSGCGDHLLVRSSWGQDRPGILVLSHLDTVHRTIAVPDRRRQRLRPRHL